MRRGLFAGALAVALLGGCGDGTSDQDAGTLDAGGRDAATAMDAGGGTDAGEPEDGGADASEAMDAGTPADAATEAVITLDDVTVYANCMPIVAPDPIITVWTANVSGAVGSLATLTDAKLTLTGTPPVSQTLTVDTPTIPLSGGSGSQTQRKTGADADPPSGCTTLCSGRTYTLELTYTVDGASVVVTDSGAFSCAH